MSNSTVKTVPTAAPLHVHKIDCLTGIRAVAAAYVILMHFAAFGYLGKPNESAYGCFLQILIKVGGAGVGFFFILSGFVLTLNYSAAFSNPRAPYTMLNYFVARFARIYPMYLLALLAAMLVAAWLNNLSIPPWRDQPPSMHISERLINLLMLQAWLPDLHSQQLFNAPAWSVSTEVVFYLLFPYLAGPVLRHAQRNGALRTGIQIYLLQLACFALFAYWMYHHHRDNPGWLLLLDRLPLLRLAEFTTGILIFEHMRQTRKPQKTSQAWIANLMLVGLILASHLIWFIPTADEATNFWRWAFDHGRAYCLALPLFAVTIHILASRQSLFAATLATPALKLAGEASYALYLLHWPVIMVLLGLTMNGEQISPWQGWMTLGVIAIFALCAYVKFEHPARQAIRAKLQVR